MIRNAGACHEMGMSIGDMLRGYLGTLDGPTRGKDLHVGDLARGVVAPISHVGSLVPVLAGIALAFRLKGEPRVALTWVGDGATRTAEFHEGLSLAAARRLPLLVVVQDNQVALGTRREVHTVADLTRIGDAYGVPSLACDGNNVLDVWAATRIAANRGRGGGGAAVIVAETFRMGGHATHDEAEARQIVPAEDFELWGKRDPVGLYEEHLVATGAATRHDLEEVERAAIDEMEAEAGAALRSRETAMPRGPEALDGVYAP
jgi:TPP-dependent pyruvate/acetoin dehydrogenase alpha subunit